MTYQNTCPHCRNEDPAPGAFCAACGLALPAAMPTPPRVVTNDDLAQTSMGQMLQADLLRQHGKRGELAMLAVAIIQTVVGVVALARSSQTLAQNSMLAITLGSFVLAAMFWGLYSWSQSQPLPAAIIGLVVYGTAMGLSITFSLKRMAHGVAGRTGLGLGIGYVDVLVMMALFRAVYAGVIHRRLIQQAATGNSGMAPPATGYDVAR